MRIVIIGAGNVATHLGLRLKQTGAEISQVYSRTEKSAKKLAEILDVPYCTELSLINKDAELYLYAVSDIALQDIINQINTPEATHIHTAGSVSMNIFEKYAANYGVLYPLQTFSKDKEVDFKKIPLFLEGNNESTVQVLTNLATAISDIHFFADSEKRRLIHLSAVFACNFTNYMYLLAGEIASKAEIPYELLLPLIEETADKVNYLSPKEAQTGPAVRNDDITIQNHITLLEYDHDAQEIYRLISTQIKRKFSQQCEISVKII